MQRKALWKDTLREIGRSKTRFLSILAIIMIGVAFFAGISATGPDMLDTADTYYKEQNLMDLKVVSTMGLEENDKDILESIGGAKVEARYTQDVVISETDMTTKVVGYNASSHEINLPVLIEGRLPESSNEIALDSTSAYQEEFNIGEIITLETNEESDDLEEALTNHSFEIVGFVKNPLFIEGISRGRTNQGSGTLNGFAYVMEEVFDTSFYSEAYITFPNATEQTAYTDGYKEFIEEQIEEVESLLENRPQERLEDLREEIEVEINDGRQEIADAVQELEEAEAKLVSEEENLDRQWILFNQQLAELEAAAANLSMLPHAQAAEIQQARTELEQARAQLQSGQAALDEARETFEEEQQTALEEIEEAEIELDDAQEQLDALTEPDYFVFDRTTNPGYSEYGANADRLASIAKIFPVFFFLLAALISLTTLTRMVEEERSHIGTLKALGYSNSQISLKYFFYAFTATVVGVGLGLAIGFTLFPTVIFNAYGSLYNFDQVKLNFFWFYAILSLVVSLISTGLAALIAVRVSLQSTAASLMRRKAPKVGKKIWLERMTGIWKRLTFTQKVAARNLFRYKQRMIMTIIGISGCTALLLTGFGLSDSISGIADIQYGELNQYQAVVALDPAISTDESNELRGEVDAFDEVNQTLGVYQETISAEKEGDSYEATLFVPENMSDFSSFVTLIDPSSDEIFPLNEEGAVVSEKLANLLSLTPGDTFIVETSEYERSEVIVASVTENYIGHMIYLPPHLYAEQSTEKWVDNSLLLSFDSSEVDEDTLGNQLTALDSIVGVTFVSSIYEAISDTLGSLDVVTVVIIVSAGMLAFVVLYNLTNINVSERIRELSTIKVLGFYNKEVTMYIYRENMVLTIMGTVVGLFLGVFLHGFVLQTAEMDNMMFTRVIHPSSFVYASLMTFLFSTIVMLIMHLKLKKVDMVEALKAEE